MDEQTKRTHDLPDNLQRLREAETADYRLDVQQVRKMLIAVTGAKQEPERLGWMTRVAIVLGFALVFAVVLFALFVWIG
jgi:hypothetical protein